MIGSYIASQIDGEYKRKQYYSKKERQNCKVTECSQCWYFKICDKRRDGNETNDSN